MPLVAITVACGGPKPTANPSASKDVTLDERRSDIARAQIWTQTDVASMDVRQGPQGKGALAPFAHVACEFVSHKADGSSPKFWCTVEQNDTVKIKYGAMNPEVSGVVASSRLLWALGFSADRWYPVTVTCHHCPSAAPHPEDHPGTGDVEFPVAVLERTVSGKTIETKPDEGWSWKELAGIPPASGGAPLEQREALTLLAVMLQHTDSKPQQQRLICPGADSPANCAAPLMYVHDVGLTFGKRTLFNTNTASGPNFENWSKQAVWKDEPGCVGNLSKSWTGTIDNPVIHEAGRKFLADLLAPLTDKQLQDLFEVARFADYTKVSVDKWISEFKAKRTAIASKTCPAS